MRRVVGAGSKSGCCIVHGRRRIWDFSLSVRPVRSRLGSGSTSGSPKPRSAFAVFLATFLSPRYIARKVFNRLWQFSSALKTSASRLPPPLIRSPKISATGSRSPHGKFTRFDLDPMGNDRLVASGAALGGQVE